MIGRLGGAGEPQEALRRSAVFWADAAMMRMRYMKRAGWGRVEGRRHKPTNGTTKILGRQRDRGKGKGAALVRAEGFPLHPLLLPFPCGGLGDKGGRRGHTERGGPRRRLGVGCWGEGGRERAKDGAEGARAVRGEGATFVCLVFPALRPAASGCQHVHCMFLIFFPFDRYTTTYPGLQKMGEEKRA